MTLACLLSAALQKPNVSATTSVQPTRTSFLSSSSGMCTRISFNNYNFLLNHSGREGGGGRLRSTVVDPGEGSRYHPPHFSKPHLPRHPLPTPIISISTSSTASPGEHSSTSTGSCTFPSLSSGHQFFLVCSLQTSY